MAQLNVETEPVRRLANVLVLLVLAITAAVDVVLAAADVLPAPYRDRAMVYASAAGLAAAALGRIVAELQRGKVWSPEGHRDEFRKWLAEVAQRGDPEVAAAMAPPVDVQVGGVPVVPVAAPSPPPAEPPWPVE